MPEIYYRYTNTYFEEFRVIGSTEKLIQLDRYGEKKVDKEKRA